MKTSLLIPNQFPEYFRNNYPGLVSFIQQYYVWLENEYIPDLYENMVTLEKTPDHLVQYFQNMLDMYHLTDNVPNQRSLLEKIKSVYQTKGSVEGIKLFFRLVFGLDSSVIIPWDYVFKTSSGIWKQNISILVSNVTGDINQLNGRRIYFSTKNNTYETAVSSISQRTDTIYELFITRFFNEPPKDIISFYNEDNTIFGTCLQTTVKVQVQNGGKDFKIGQVFSTTTLTGKHTLIKIKDVTATGAINAAEIIFFGYGYNTDFNMLITPEGSLDQSLLGSRITLGNYTYKTNDYTNSQNEKGIIVHHDYTDLARLYMVDPTYVGHIVGEMVSQEKISSLNINYASLLITTGSICIYPGYYQTNDNLIGDMVYTQDSSYYQMFSYKTSTTVDLSDYKDAFEQLMHPAGTKHYAEYEMSHQIRIHPTIIPTLDIIKKQDFMRDSAITAETIHFILDAILEKQTANIEDALEKTVEYIRTYSDDIFVKHLERKLFGKFDLLENTNITDFIQSYSRGMRPEDVTAIVDLIASVMPNKYAFDTVTVAHLPGSGAYNTPYYAHPLSPLPYWEPTYLQSERLFADESSDDTPDQY